MNQPPDDPFHNSTTENDRFPPQWQGQMQNYPQQPSAPNNPQGYRPPQGPMNQPGVPPQVYPQQGPYPNSAGQPGQWQGNFPPPQGPGNVQGPPPLRPNGPQNQPPQGFPAPGTFPPQGQAPVMMPPGWSPPPTQPTPPLNKPRRRGGLIVISIIVILVLLLGGGGLYLVFQSKNAATGSKSTPTTNTSTTQGVTPGSTPGSNNAIHIVGQPVQAGTTWVVTVTKVQTNSASAIPPQAGSTYLEISLTLKNVSKTTQLISSVVEFTLADAKGTKYIQAVADTNVHQHADGNVAAGQTLNAQISYSIPQSAHAFLLTFNYGLPSGNAQAVAWTLNV